LWKAPQPVVRQVIFSVPCHPHSNAPRLLCPRVAGSRPTRQEDLTEYEEAGSASSSAESVSPDPGQQSPPQYQTGSGQHRIGLATNSGKRNCYTEPRQAIEHAWITSLFFINTGAKGTMSSPRPLDNGYNGLPQAIPPDVRI